MVNIRRIVVTYKIFINKQLIYANVTMRLTLFIYINIPVHRLSSSRAMLASDVGIAVLAISRRWDPFLWSAVFRRCRRRRRLQLVHRLPPGGDLLHEHVTTST